MDPENLLVDIFYSVNQNKNIIKDNRRIILFIFLVSGSTIPIVALPP